MKLSAFVSVVIFLALIGVAIGYADDEFYYSYTDPSTKEAQQYIISTRNAELKVEGQVTYWKPKFGDSTKAATQPGTIIYHFDFDRRIKSGFLNWYASCYHWWYSRGEAYLYASPDGQNWIKLAEAASPAEAAASYASFNAALPEELLQVSNVYLKAELYSYGEKASEGGIWTNTAQHSRHQQGSDARTFELGVEFEKWIEALMVRTVIFSEDGEETAIHSLIAGETSQIACRLYNNTDNEVQTRLTFGLKVGSRELVTIGQKDITLLPIGEDHHYEWVEVTTPLDAKGASGGTLLALLHEKSTEKLLDTLRAFVPIRSDPVVMGTFYLLLMQD